MKISATDVKSDWLIEKLPSFDLEHAARFEFSRMQFESARVEQLIQSIKPEFLARWESFVSDAWPGDTLWYFKSSPDSWASLSGRSGFVIVRDGVPFSAFLTWMS